MSSPLNAIYLDYNATAPLRPCARTAINATHDLPLNASAVHIFGRKGRQIVENARAHLSAAIDCPAAQIIFNSGATEGNNTVIRYFQAHYPDERVLISHTEHPSVYELGDMPNYIPVDQNGLIELESLEALIKNGPRVALVSIMMANNETGVIQPIEAISRIVHRHGALLHCDATQALGRIAFSMAGLGIDFLTVSAHKIGGPQGVGAMAMGLCGITPSWLSGGGQEKKARAGTENVAGIAGFGAAIEEACADIEAEAQRLLKLRGLLEERLMQIAPEAIIHSRDVERLCNTTLFSVPGLGSESLLMAFDLAGIAVSNGSACSSGTVKTSHVLGAMYPDTDNSMGTLRISTGWQTQESDVLRFLETWQTIYNRQKHKISAA